jgi:hypothetical protein
LLFATLKGSELDPAATRRELREYLALSYEANHKIAQRIGITVVTFKNFLSGKRAPQAKTLGKIRAFLRCGGQAATTLMPSVQWDCVGSFEFASTLT